MKKSNNEEKTEEEIPEAIRKEQLLTEKVDEKGRVWEKKYFGGGPHFERWLREYEELYGEENIKVEKLDSFECYQKESEMYRIWVRKSAETTKKLDELYQAKK